MLTITVTDSSSQRSNSMRSRPHLGRAYDPPQACRGPAIHWTLTLQLLHPSRQGNSTFAQMVQHIHIQRRWCGDRSRRHGFIVTWFLYSEATCVPVPRCASNAMMCQTPFVASRWVILLGNNCQYQAWKKNTWNIDFSWIEQGRVDPYLITYQKSGNQLPGLQYFLEGARWSCCGYGLWFLV